MGFLTFRTPLEMVAPLKLEMDQVFVEELDAVRVTDFSAELFL